MKKLLFILLPLTLLFACNDDGEMQCPADQFAGTYTGTTDCSIGAETLGTTALVASSSISGINITFGPEDFSGNIDGCSVNMMNSTFLGNGRVVDASFSGDQLTFTITVETAGVTIQECVFVGSR